MKKIITISREFGSGGGSIGFAIANRLGLEYYDKEIILKAARNTHMDIESVLKWDERVSLNFGFAQSLFDFYSKPMSDKLYEAQRNVIHDIGERGNCVIVGRNANTILKEYEDSLHVFIYADLNWRMEHMRNKMQGTSETKLLEEMHAIDKARKKYCSYFTNTEFGDANSYDLCLNTSSLGINTCIDIICEIATRNNG